MRHGADLGMMDSSTRAENGAERTILTTDVVGSTALLHRFPHDLIGAMDQHDQILQAAILRHRGTPFKNTGDGIFAIFDRPMDAIAAAIDIQRDMRAALWGPTGRLLIRCGIHTGVVRARGSDFFGPALPTAARLQSAANADQTLVSSATVNAIAGDPARSNFMLTDLGDHHFKGIEPVRVFQVGAADLPHVFPPIGGKRETASGNLPANLTSFLGRARELRSLLQLTADARIITLVGPGGIGKTRLAIEFARSLEASFQDGAWMVDLAALERGSEVWPAIAAALLIEPLPGIERRVQVLERLLHARAILLMDNCEHVLDQTADAVMEIGSSCGTVFCINTSRRTLAVEGEAVYEVPALNDAADDDPALAVGVRLFIERGRFADRHFQPAQDDLAAIQSICDHLEHIPLAIEIAARNLRRLSLDEIAAAVIRPLDLHDIRSSRRAGRHQTLWHTLQWSYDLLDANSQQILLRLSVFSGSFREEQALAVCAADALGQAQALRGIDDLLESSLLARDSGGGRQLRMLQTVQAFGREKLNEAGRLESVERRHAEVFAARCHKLAELLASDKEAKATNAIYDDMVNLRSAFERSITRDLALAADIVAPLFLFNYAHRGAETSDWYRRIMVRPGADQLRQAPIILAGAAVHALHNIGDPKLAASYIKRGLMAEAAGGDSSRGWLCGVAGQIELWAGRATQCIEHHITAADQARQQGNFACEITSLSTAAFVMARLGKLDDAEKLLGDIRQISGLATQPSLVGYVNYAIGGVESFRNVSKAIEEYSLSAEWASMGGNHLGALRVRHLIADLQAASAAPRQAVAIHVRTLVDLPAHGATFYEWSTIRALMSPLAELAAFHHIAIISGALQASPIKLDRSARQAISKAREALGDDAFEQAAQRGAGFDLTATRSYIITAAQEFHQIAPEMAAAQTS